MRHRGGGHNLLRFPLGRGVAGRNNSTLAIGDRVEEGSADVVEPCLGCLGKGNYICGPNNVRSFETAIFSPEVSDGAAMDHAVYSAGQIMVLGRVHSKTIHAEVSAHGGHMFVIDGPVMDEARNIHVPQPRQERLAHDAGCAGDKYPLAM